MEKKVKYVSLYIGKIFMECFVFIWMFWLFSLEGKKELQTKYFSEYIYGLLFIFIFISVYSWHILHKFHVYNTAFQLYAMLTTSMVTICHHTTLFQYHWLIPCTVPFVLVIFSFHNWKTIFPTSLHPFCLSPFPPPPSLW